MDGTSIPIGWLHWLLAASPIIVLAFLLVKLRWTAQQAGATGMFVAAAVALLIFQTPLETLAVAGGKGVWDSAPILFVIWAALLLYHIMDKSGGYEALRQGIVSFSPNEVFIVVALGWIFTSFLQGIDGFGTPIVIVAPLLVAIGMKPVYAVAIPIIAHIWAKFYGTLGVGWLATLQVVDLDPATVMATAVQSSLLLAIQVILGGFWVVWMYGRWEAVRHAWPLVVILSLIQGIGQIIVSYFEPVLAAFIPAAVALAALYPLSRWRRYAEPVEIPVRPAMLTEHMEELTDKKAPMGVLTAAFPYLLLSLLALGTSLITPIADALSAFRVGLPFPAVTTGYDIFRAEVARYSAMAPLASPGASLLVVAFITWVVFKQRGFFAVWQRTNGVEQSPRLVLNMLQSSVPASVPIIAFLVMARIMDHSGQNEALAYGIAAVAPAYLFAFLSNGIGIIGAFSTSSSTSSNTLFSGLQVTLAELKELPVATILASQSAGGAIGNAIGPANLVLGASTAGISGREGEILRKTLPWTVVAFVLTGFATLIMVAVGM